MKKPWPFHPTVFLATRLKAPGGGGGGGDAVCGGGGIGVGDPPPSENLGISLGEVGVQGPRGEPGSPEGPALGGDAAALGLLGAVGPSGGLCEGGAPGGRPTTHFPWGEEEDDWMPLDGEALFS